MTASYTLDGDPATQTQILDGGSGRGGQSEHILTFGLGDHAGDVDLSIRWPSGNDQLVTVSSTEITGSQVRPPFAVADSTYVTVSPGTFDFSHTLLPSELLEWTFTWETTKSSEWARDAVLLTVPGVAPKTASPHEGNATVVVTPMPGGGYHHELTVTTECVQGIYRFQVRSTNGLLDEFGDLVVESDWYEEELTQNNRFCPSGGGGIHPGS